MAPSLNPPQYEAVHTLSGPLLVLAGAGTGKTRVVTYRIAELIRNGTRPERILAVTFTNKAAREMQQRAGKLLGRSSRQKPEISTFHSLCVRILRRHAERLGYSCGFAIYDRGDQESLARAALREIKVEQATLRPGDLLFQISRWKSASVRMDEAASRAETDKEHLAALAYRRYQRALKAAGAVDFDDLLLLTEELFTKHAEARRMEAARFDHLLIDEYQDTNGSQYRIVRGLADAHRNLCVVGDDDQSIYGWRGAEVTHILRFQRDWPDARVVRLEDNYRSQEPILALANRLIAFNKQRHDKVLRAARPGDEDPRILMFPDETNEADEVVSDIYNLMHEGRAQPRDVAILFRTNEQPRPFEQVLRKLKIPYVLVGGMSFFDRKEIRDVMAYLKLCAKPDDELSLLRIINTPARGIGKGSIEELQARSLAQKKTLWEVASSAAIDGSLPASATAGLQSLCGAIQRFAIKFQSEPLAETLRRLLTEVGYFDELERAYPDPNERQSRQNSLEEVVNSLATYQARATEPSLAGFLDDLALSGRDDEPDKEDQLRRNAVVLMTLHAAKGLEFPHVYLVGMEDGLLPHRRSLDTGGDAIEEERRLCYVGITRAQDRLTLTLSLSRHKWGQARPTIPSQFLFELNGEAENPRLIEVKREAQAKLRKMAKVQSRGVPARDGSHSATASKPKRAAGGRTPSRRPRSGK
jgi:DNA helicase-2/ATP-dependent DNA helicase PcrA